MEDNNEKNTMEPYMNDELMSDNESCNENDRREVHQCSDMSLNEEGLPVMTS